MKLTAGPGRPWDRGKNRCGVREERWGGGEKRGREKEEKTEGEGRRGKYSTILLSLHVKHTGKIDDKIRQRACSQAEQRAFTNESCVTI